MLHFPLFDHPSLAVVNAATCMQSLETATGESMAGPYVPMTQPQSELEPPKLKVTKEEMDNAVLVGLCYVLSQLQVHDCLKETEKKVFVIMTGVSRGRSSSGLL